MVTFLFSVHTITEAKQYAGLGQSQGLCQGGGSSSQVIWPGMPWCSAATCTAVLRGTLLLLKGSDCDLIKKKMMMMMMR